VAARAAPRSIRVLQLLALVAPPIAIALLIDRYGVDVPITDQWNGMVPLFEELDAGTLDLGDFYAQHNEHRILFPG
jgi:hypothetical protein